MRTESVGGFCFSHLQSFFLFPRVRRLLFCLQEVGGQSGVGGFVIGVFFSPFLSVGSAYFIPTYLSTYIYT